MIPIYHWKYYSKEKLSDLAMLCIEKHRFVYFTFIQHEQASKFCERSFGFPLILFSSTIRFTVFNSFLCTFIWKFSCTLKLPSYLSPSTQLYCCIYFLPYYLGTSLRRVDVPKVFRKISSVHWNLCVMDWRHRKIARKQRFFWTN